MKRKRYLGLGFLGVVASALLVFALACGGGEDAPSPAPAPAPTAASAPIAAPAPTTAAPAPTARPIPTAAPTGPKYGGTLRYAAENKPDTLDPHLTAVADIYAPGFAIFARLLELKPDGSVKPLLAKSWDVSSDGRVVTFQLEQGVKFHDGTPFNAEAVAWNFNRILDPDVPSPRRTEIGEFIDKVTAAGEYAVSFHLPRRFRALLPTLATERAAFIQSPAAVEKFGRDSGRNPVGAGPFKFVEWFVGDRIVMEKNEDYWEDGLPYLDKILMQSVPAPELRLAMLRTGETDIIQKGRMRPEEVPLVENNADLQVITIPGIATYGMLFNLSNPVYKNKALREGMNYAFNRENVVKGAFAGAGRPAYTMESQGWAHFPDMEIFKYDPVKAKAKLAEAGYQGEKLPLACLATSRNLGICETYQAVWADEGINIAIEAVPRDRMWGPTNHSYEEVGFMSTWYTHRSDPYLRLSWIYFSDGWYNPQSAYNDPEVDRLLREAQDTYDIAKATEAYRKAQKRGSEAALWVYAVWADGFTGMRKAVKGYIPTATIGDRLHKLWLDE